MTARERFPSSSEKTAATVALALAQQQFLRHLIHRRVVAEPETARPLFLAPHPDDLELGCGGTLLKLIRKGVPARLAYLTDGRAAAGGEPIDEAADERMAATRTEEAKRVSRHLGLQGPVLLGWNERTFRRPEHEAELTARVADLLEKARPDAVFLPSPWDQHGDHRYANHLLARALLATGLRPLVHGYEVWSFVPPGLVVDISAELEEKKELLRLYPSQLAILDYLQLVDVVGRFHAPLAPGATACEAFWPFRPEAYLEFLDTLDLGSTMGTQVSVLLTRPETMP